VASLEVLKNVYRGALERPGGMTLVELVVAQSERLKRAGVSFGHGTGNAFDEAAWLVTWAIGQPLDALETRGQRDVTPGDIAKAEALVARRIETRQPAAYLTGEAWLQNVPFTIDARSIVPRSYIAELLADGEETGTLDAWLSERTRRVLDLCTGNGSLAVIAAMAYPEIEVDAADISPQALALAASTSPGTGSSRGSGSSSPTCSPPAATLRPDPLQPALRSRGKHARPAAEYRAEPALALAGGSDGMDLIRRIVAEAPDHLSDAACWCSRSATSAPASRPPSRASNAPGWRRAPAKTRSS
jgi:ribosomal protein L3 glutamine methyltransferase